MTRRTRSPFRGAMVRRIPILTRIGWATATSGNSRPIVQTAFGIGLMGAGVVLKRNRRRKVLYRGDIKPGSGTHIRVYKGSSTVYDGPLGG